MSSTRLRGVFAGRWVLALATGVLAFRMLVAIAVVPPWQLPDEPTHLLFARILASQETRDMSQRTDPVIEAEVIASMAEHGWWRFYGRALPDPLPATLGDAGLSVVDTGPTVYYRGAAWVLQTLGVRELLDQLYFLRWVSALLGLATLWCGWAGTRRLFGGEVADVTVLMIALLPQFALISTGVAPGPLVSLCGAVLWWQAAALLTGGRRVRTTTLLWGAALLGVFSKREGIPLAVMAGGVTVLALLRAWANGVFRTERLLVAAGVGAAVAVTVGALVSGEPIWILDSLSNLLLFRSMSVESGTWEYFQRFSLTLLDSTWFFAGWMRYPAPMLTVWLVRVAVAVSFVGLALVIWRQRSTMPMFPVWIALGVVVIQLAAIYAVHFRLHVGPQGRYLFPVLAPVCALIWIGLRGWCPDRAWPGLAAGLVAALALLDLVGWTAVLIPIYA